MTRVRLTVFRLLLAVAVCAIVTYLATAAFLDRARERSGRFLEIADNHARLGREYRRNAGGDPGLLRIAAWHERMSQAFEAAAARPELSPPVSRPFPPKGWRGPVGRGAADGG